MFVYIMHDQNHCDITVFSSLAKAKKAVAAFAKVYSAKVKWNGLLVTFVDAEGEYTPDDLEILKCKVL